VKKAAQKRAREELNVVSLEAFIIFGFCLLGCAYTSWKAGQARGIVATLHYLEKEGVITLEEK